MKNSGRSTNSKQQRLAFLRMPFLPAIWLWFLTSPFSPLFSSFLSFFFWKRKISLECVLQAFFSQKVFFFFFKLIYGLFKSLNKFCRFVKCKNKHILFVRPHVCFKFRFLSRAGFFPVFSFFSCFPFSRWLPFSPNYLDYHFLLLWLLNFSAGLISILVLSVFISLVLLDTSAYLSCYHSEQVCLHKPLLWWCWVGISVCGKYPHPVLLCGTGGASRAEEAAGG